MTLDELVDVFNEHAKLPSIRKADIAGIRAVVEALRDEADEYHTARAVTEMLNAILASDGEVKAAGSVAGAQGAVEALPAEASCNAPAAAPVCVWTRTDEDVLESGCDPDGWTYNPEIKRDTCPSCGKPIKFKEAAR
jgi:hypothetical protein